MSATLKIGQSMNPSAEEIAAAVLFLASPAASFVTGADLRVDAEGKERALRAAILRLRAEGYRFVRLADAAEAFAQ